MSPQPPGPETLERWIQQAGDGDLSAADADALNACLKQSAEARALYREYQVLASLLEDHAEAAEQLPDPIPQVPSAATRPMPETVEQRITTMRKKAVVQAFAIAAVFLALAGVWFQFIDVGSPYGSVRAAGSSRWEVTRALADEGAGRAPGEREIAPGDTILLHCGMLELALPGGTRAIFNAPAEARLVSLDTIDLRSGTLSVRVGASAERAIVHTPLATITDLGTAFSTSVEKESGDATTVSVHVVSGAVSVTPQGGDPTRDREVLKGEAISISSQDGAPPTWSVVPYDDSTFAATLPESIPLEKRRIETSFGRGADLFVRSGTPLERFGESPVLSVQGGEIGSPYVCKTYLRFDLREVTKPVASADLVLWVVENRGEWDDTPPQKQRLELVLVPESEGKLWDEDRADWMIAPLNIGGNQLSERGKSVTFTTVLAKEPVREITIPIHDLSVFDRIAEGTLSLILRHAENASGGYLGFASKEGARPTNTRPPALILSISE